MASKLFFSHQKVYFWISAFDHRAIVLDKMHIVHWWHQHQRQMSDCSVERLTYVQWVALIARRHVLVLVLLL